MEAPTCPSCPAGTRLVPGDNTLYVCHKCGYESHLAASFFDERVEMLGQMDALEKYSGMMKDNTIGGARIVRNSRGQAMPGQEVLRARIYTQEQNQAMKDWVVHLAVVKLGLTPHTADRADHSGKEIIKSLNKRNRTVKDYYILAACVAVHAAQQKRIVNHLELAEVTGMDPDRLQHHMMFCRKQLKHDYDAGNQPTSYIEMVLRHIKAIIEQPEESRVHNKEQPYPDETLHFLHLAHPVLLGIRKMSTEIAEMLATLSVNYARNPGMSACAIVLAAMEGVTGVYTHQNGCLFDELAAFLPKASAYTVRERYLEILSVVFDLGQYLGDIGHPVEKIPVWRHMVRRAPPRRHMFAAFLPSVVRHWRDLLAWQKSQGKAHLQTAVGEGRLDGEELWKVLLPGRELPKPSIRGKKKDGVAEEDAVREDLTGFPAAGRSAGDADGDRLQGSVSTSATNNDSETSVPGFPNTAGKRPASDSSVLADERPVAKRSRRSQRTEEQKAASLARSKELRRERDKKRRDRLRVEAYGRRKTVVLAGDTQAGMPSDKAEDDPNATPCSPDAPLGRRLEPEAGPSTDPDDKSKRSLSLKNRAVYARKRRTKPADYKVPAQRRLVLAYLRKWKKEHAGKVAVSQHVSEYQGENASKQKNKDTCLQDMLLAGFPIKNLPSFLIPTSVLGAQILLGDIIADNVDDLSDDALFDPGELDDYVCSISEKEARQRQWNEDGMDRYLPKNLHLGNTGQIAEDTQAKEGHGDADAARDFNEAVNDMLAHAQGGANPDIEWSDDDDDDDDDDQELDELDYY